MDVAYFSKSSNNVSRLGSSSVRNGQQEAQGIGFDGYFDQLLKEDLDQCFRANGVNDVATNVEENDSRRVKDKRD